MAFEVVMPRLGWNMEEGTLAGWRKKDGETVTAGEILFEVESDKALQEVEALESGTLCIPPDSPPLGTLMPVGTFLAWLLAPGEAMPVGKAPAAAAPAAAGAAPISKTSPAAAPAAVPASTAAAGAPPAARAGGRPPAISPRARRVATELAVEWTGLRGSGSTGRIVERDVRRAASEGAGGRPLPDTPRRRFPAPAGLSLKR